MSSKGATDHSRRLRCVNTYLQPTPTELPWSPATTALLTTTKVQAP